MKFLKNMLFEEQPEFEKKKDTPPPAPGAPNLPSTPTFLSQPVGFASTVVPNNTVATTPSVGSDPNLKQEIMTDLMSNLDPKYAQFKTMSNSMASVITDTKQRLNAAYAALKATGTSKADLIGAPSRILETLKAKKNEVNSVVQTQLNTIAKTATEQTTNLTAMIEQKQQQIQALNAEIEKIKVDQSNVVNQINSQRIQIDNAHAQFWATANEIEKELTTEITDLTTYITE